jgi:uncharacterized protein YcbX
MVLNEIYIYPIKSARGIPVDETAVDVSGPRQDRRWMLVDNDGRFLSQRVLPRMTLISPCFHSGDLVVEAPGMSPLVIPSWSGEGEWVSVQVWRDRLMLPHPSVSYSDWCSKGGVSCSRQRCFQSCRSPYATRPVWTRVFQI